MAKKQEIPKGHWRNCFDMPYIGAWTLDGKTEIVVTIEKVVIEEVVGNGGRKEDCPIAYLKGDIKPFVLNKTNMATIEKVTGEPHPDKWAGKSITIYADKTKDFSGVWVECLRVRDKAPAPEQTLAEALKEIAGATTHEALMAVWHKNKSKQNDTSFTKALGDAKAKLTTQTK